LKPATHRANSYSWKKFVELTGVRLLDGMTSETMKKFKTKAEAVGLAPAYISMILRDVSKLMKFAKKKKLITDNPCEDIQHPEEEDVARVLTDEEQDTLIEHANPTLRRCLILALNTGLRISQIVFLDWKQVKLGEGLIHIPGQKRQKARHIPILKAVPEALGEPKVSGRIFDGITCDGVEKMWGRLQDAGNKGGWFKGSARFHDLRHTFCTRMGPILGPFGLRDLMGWHSVSMTDRYCHTNVRAIQDKLKGL
jgi:integrase